jgi:Ca2+-binding RTX toxin-like protein
VKGSSRAVVGKKIGAHHVNPIATLGTAVNGVVYLDDTLEARATLLANKLSSVDPANWGRFGINGMDNLQLLPGDAESPLDGAQHSGSHDSYSAAFAAKLRGAIMADPALRSFLDDPQRFSDAYFNGALPANVSSSLSNAIETTTWQARYSLTAPVSAQNIRTVADLQGIGFLSVKDPRLAVAAKALGMDPQAVMDTANNALRNYSFAAEADGIKMRRDIWGDAPQFTGVDPANVGGLLDWAKQVVKSGRAGKDLAIASQLLEVDAKLGYVTAMAREGGFINGAGGVLNRAQLVEAIIRDPVQAAAMFAGEKAIELGYKPVLTATLQTLGASQSRIATVLGLSTTLGLGVAKTANAAGLLYEGVSIFGSAQALYKEDAYWDFEHPFGANRFGDGAKYVVDSLFDPAREGALGTVVVPHEYAYTNDVYDETKAENWLNQKYASGGRIYFMIHGKPGDADFGWDAFDRTTHERAYFTVRISPGADANSPDGRTIAAIITKIGEKGDKLLIENLETNTGEIVEDPTGELEQLYKVMLDPTSSALARDAARLALNNKNITSVTVYAGSDVILREQSQELALEALSTAGLGDVELTHAPFLPDIFNDPERQDEETTLTVVVDGVVHAYRGAVRELRQIGFAVAKYVKSVPGMVADGPSSVFNDAYKKLGEYNYGAGILSAKDVGGLLASQLMRSLPIDDPWARMGTSTALGAIMSDLGAAIDAAGGLGHLAGVGAELEGAFKDFGDDILSSGLGAVSSYLVGDLLGGLGLEGDELEAATAFAGPTIGKIAYNLVKMAQPGGEVLHWNSGITVNLYATAAASFIGGKLADELVDFASVYGQVGAALGEAVGTIVATKLFSASLATGNPYAIAGAAIVIALSKILGGLIGSMFGASKSYATISWDSEDGVYAVGAASSKRGGSKQAALSLASGVAEVLNNIVDTVGASVLGSDVPDQQFGMRNKDYIYWNAPAGYGVSDRSRDFNEIMTFGVRAGLTNAVSRMGGGDIYAKRALLANLTYSGTNFSVEGLMGDLSTAADYATYATNRATLETLIGADTQSAFAATWMITLARAHELGLDRRASTDWIGGWNLFLDEVADNVIGDLLWSPASLIMHVDRETAEREFIFLDEDGMMASVMGDSIDSASKTRVTGTGAADTITVTGAMLAPASGVIVKTGQKAAESAASPYKISIAATIDAGDGADVVRAGDLGNDVLGGAGNDTIVGGVLDDWLFGEDGNDVLFAGDVVSAGMISAGQLAGVNASGAIDPAAVVNVDGGNGNLLDGGAGDDRLYGSRGSDWLTGGAGVDRLYGGSGADILEGGAGDDQAAGGAAIFGGGGSDQYLFNYGDGKDVILDEQDGGGSVGGDSLSRRVAQIAAGQLARDWAGGGDYQVDGSVRGGEDAIAFGAGITIENVILRRSGSEGAAGGDLIIQLTTEGPGGQVATGDELVIKDWFESSRRVEWLRFVNGDELRIGDMTSYVIGTGGNDVILGTYGADFLYGGDGDDELRGLGGDDFGSGGLGNDLVAGDEDQDWVTGGAGNDQVLGGSGNDTVFGDDGDDFTYGGSGSDLVVGGKGDDQVVGGAGDDVFRYNRGEGRDILLDDLVDNWDQIYSGTGYVNGYELGADGKVRKGGVVYFDGSHWVGGGYDWNDQTQTLRRHMGAVNGVISANNGVDTLEFGVGIDIQDLVFRRNGGDLQIAIIEDGDLAAFDGVGDQITIKDWFTVGKSIENFVFAATGRHATLGLNLAGGGDGADTLLGTSGDDWITGGAGDDVVAGGAGSDILVGDSGSDTLRGDAGADVLYGGAGDDVLAGGAGADRLFGGEGTDLASYAGSEPVRAYLNATFANTGDAVGDIYESVEGLAGSSGDDVLGGDDDDNVLQGGLGSDRLFGGGGDDTYVFDGGADVVSDGFYAVQEILKSDGALNGAEFTATWTDLGQGVVVGATWYRYRLTVTRKSDGAVVYQSRDNIDFLYGAAHALPPGGEWPANEGQWKLGALRSGNGLQTIWQTALAGDGGVDNLEMTGVSLSDLSFTAQGADLVIAVSGGASVTLKDQSVVERRVESLVLDDGLAVDLTALRLAGQAATSGVDLMVGGAGADTLDGLAGDDVLSGAGGSDVLRGGDGDDILEGGAGADTLDGGVDSVSLNTTLDANDQTKLRGDTIRYVRSGAGVTIDLAARTAAGGDAQGDVIVAVSGVSTIENIVGSDGFADSLSGDARANRLSGLGGDDVIDGRGGDDVLVGGAGADRLYGGDGTDALAGEEGDDRLEGGIGDDLLSGGAGRDVLLGGDGLDRLSGDAGDDELHGEAGDDTLGGQEGADLLYGEAGDDVLAGGAGDDQLFGGDGNDQLAGEAGSDLLTGGAGADAYLFDAKSGSDRIVDAQGVNRVELANVTKDQVWLRRAGNDLIVSVIGGDTNVTLQDFYVAGGTAVRHIALADSVLFLGAASPLVLAMTQASASTPTPAVMPAEIKDLLASYWHAGTTAAPIVSDLSLTLAEDTILNGQVVARDDDDDIIGYSVASQGGKGTVAIDAVTGAWTYTPNPNANGTDRFQLRVTDASGNKSIQVVDLTITPVNDGPGEPTVDRVMALDEGSAIDTIVGKFNAIDADGDALTYSLADNAGDRFKISADGVLSVLNSQTLDFETSNGVYTVRVKVSDGTAATEKNFDITVRDVNETPYVPEASTPQPAILGEGALGGQTAVAFRLNDPDRNNTLGLEIVSQPSDWLEVVGGELRFKTGKQIDIETLAASGWTLGDIDHDGVKDVAYTVTLRTGDGQMSSPTIQQTIYVEDVNEAPTNLALAGVSSIIERDNPVSGEALDPIVLGTLSASDPDSLSGANFGALQFTLENPNDPLFEIVDNAILRLKAGARLDFETTPTVSVKVIVTDRAGAQGGLTASRTFTFNVQDRDDYIYGSINADVLNGAAGRDIIDGGSGNDVIDGKAGTDLLKGAGGDDKLYGGDGDDTLDGDVGDDQLEGGAGVDTLTGGDGKDRLFGQDGADTLSGGANDDRLEGGLGADLLQGDAGNDELRGQVDNDRLLGGDGDDLLIGGAGADRFNGGDGRDTVSYAEAGSEVIVNLVTGGTGGEATGDVFEDVIEVLVGTDYDDSLTGGDGGVEIQGGKGNDLIVGGAGVDILYGGDGDDTLQAFGGPDKLYGGAGSDTLVGGEGSDTFYIDRNSGSDIIWNFDPNGEDIDVVGYDNIDQNVLWFSRDGNNLVVSVVGTNVVTAVKDWYLRTDPNERANYKIDFFLLGEHYTPTVNAEALVNLMAGYTMPATVGDYQTLHADSAFETPWKTYWGVNKKPVISSSASAEVAIGGQSINEDGTITVSFYVRDDIVSFDNLNVTAQVVQAGDTSKLDDTIVYQPTVKKVANGLFTVDLLPRHNANGTATIKILASDGTLISEQLFTLTVTAVADAPLISRLQTNGNTFSGGAEIGLDIQVTPQGANETVKVTISNLVNGLSLNQGIDKGNGVWELTLAQLNGLKLRGSPSAWADLTGTAALTITATATETGVTQTASTSQALNIVINGKPTSVSGPATLTVDESTASIVAQGTPIGTFSGVDPDGDGLTFSLENFTDIFQFVGAQLQVKDGASLNYEAKQTYDIVVRATDPSGLWVNSTFTVRINPKPEAPNRPTLSGGSLKLQENTGGGQIVATLSGSVDPDGTTFANGSTVTYEIADDNLGWFQIVNGGQVQLKPSVVPNFEALKALIASNSSLTLTDDDNNGRQEVTYTVHGGAYGVDGLRSPVTNAIVVRIEDVNEAPNTPTPGTATWVMDEGLTSAGATVAVFSATDPDGTNPTFQLVSDPLSLFNINKDTGALTWQGRAVDFEALIGQARAGQNGMSVQVAGGQEQILYSAQVRSYDGQYLSPGVSTVSVTIRNINEKPNAPIEIGGLGIINEGVYTDQALRILRSDDPDGGTAPVYMTANASGAFFVSGNAVYLNRGVSIDFDEQWRLGASADRYFGDVDGDGRVDLALRVGVQGNDGQYWSDPTSTWVWFRDVNEAADFNYNQGGTFLVSENAPGAGQTSIGTVAIDDPDTQSYFRKQRFSISTNDYVSINGETGELILQRQMDFETVGSVAVQVTVQDWDNPALTRSRWFTVQATDENERPGGTIGGRTFYNSAKNGVIEAIHTMLYWDDEAAPLSQSLITIEGADHISTGEISLQGQDVINDRIRFKFPVGAYNEGKVGVVITDYHGASSIAVIAYRRRTDVKNYDIGPSSPIMFDLTGQGLKFTSLADSEIMFDQDGDGQKDVTGWAKAGTGMLVLDRNGDGVINNGSEISFTADVPNGVSDLEGLRAYDSNANGFFDSADAQFSAFRVWDDVNQDGVSQASELKALSYYNISAVNLTLTRTNENPEGATDNVLYGTSEFVRTNGTKGLVGDVVLAYQLPALEIEYLGEYASVEAYKAADPYYQVTTRLNGTAAAETLNGSVEAEIIAGSKGADQVKGGGGSDTYVWNLGDGADVITDDGTGGGDVDTLYMTDVMSNDVLLTQTGQDVTVKVISTGETLTLKNQRAGGGAGVERMVFKDLIRVDGEIAAGIAVRGTNASETLQGASSADNLIGGLGDDTLVGGGGSDVYAYKSGDGADVIDDLADSAGVPGFDILDLGDLGAAQVTLGVSGSDLTVRINATGQTIRVLGQFATDLALTAGDNAGRGVEQIRFTGGASLSREQIFKQVMDGQTGQGNQGTIWADTILGGEGAETITGLAGDDVLFGFGGADVIYGGEGHDQIGGGAGDDKISGGEGYDTIIYDGAVTNYTFSRNADGTVKVTAKTGSDGVDTLDGVEAFWFEADSQWRGIQEMVGDYGTEGDDDFLLGSANDDNLYGLGGADQLFGGAGKDRIYGGAGEDLIYGQAGDDVIDGGAGDDEIGYAGKRVNFTFSRNADGSVTVVDSTGVEGTDRLIDVEYLYFAGDPSGAMISDVVVGYGTAAADTINGAGGKDNIYGLAGDDTLQGFGGDDRIDGGDGSDTAALSLLRANYSFVRNADGSVKITALSGAEGVDTLIGVETVLFKGDNTRVAVQELVALKGTAGNDALFQGTSYAETMYGLAGDDGIRGLGGDDFLDGGAGYDTALYLGVSTNYTFSRNADGSIKATAVAGNEGTDTYVNIEAVYFEGDGVWKAITDLVPSGIYGTTGNDTVTGTSAAESLYGLAGDDTLQGLAGNDRIDGGAGADTAVFALQRTNYTYSRNSDGSVKVTATSGTDGVDTLYDVETVLFQGNNTRVAALDLVALKGTAGADSLMEGTALQEWMYGLGGDDSIRGWGGDDRIDGGAGYDTALYYGASTNYTFSRNADGTIQATALAGSEGNDTLVNVEAVYFEADETWAAIDDLVGLTVNGTTGNDDWVAGAGGSDVLNGLAGDDSLYGGGGNDVIHGGAGYDTLVYEQGMSNYVFTQNTDGTVRVRALSGNEGIDTVDGIEAVYFDSTGEWATLASRISGQTPPVVLDLDGDGVELVSRASSSVTFDMLGDGVRRNTGWVASDDGLLVLDRNGDGVIGDASEISFKNDLPGAVSDLEGLAAFDSNKNGWFDGGDARFGEFKVWRDLNQDGVSQAAELGGLADYGVTAIGLTLSLTGAKPEGAVDNVIYATSALVRAGGLVGTVGDVMLAYGPTTPAGSGASGDAGVGAAKPGGVDRNADETSKPRKASLAQSIRQAMEANAQKLRGQAWDASLAPLPNETGELGVRRNADRFGPLASDPSQAYEARLSQADVDVAPSIQAGRSALDKDVALAGRLRFQMINAMAAFNPSGGADIGIASRERPRTAALLTTLPSYGQIT